MSDQPSKINGAAIVSLVAGAAIFAGTFLKFVGVLPLYVSAREPGFDKLEFQVRLAPLLVVIWLGFAFARPKGLVALAAVVCTVYYATGFFFE